MNVRGALRTGLATAAAGAMIVGVGGLSAEAQTAGTVLSQSTARVLSGSLGSTSLDTVAEADGTVAKNYGGAPVTKVVTPDLGLLNNAIKVPLGQVKTSLGDAVPGLSLKGTVEQSVTARANGSAQGKASTAGLGLDLGTLTQGASDPLTSLTLGFGALTAQAAQKALPDGAQSGSCTIAGLNLDLTSPALQAIFDNLDAGLKQLDAAAATITNAVGQNGVVIVHLPTTQSLVNKLTYISLLDGAVLIDLQKGTVHVDLAALLAQAGLNFCDNPNTKPLDQLGAALGNQIPTLLSSLLTGTVESATNLLKPCAPDVQDKSDCVYVKVAGTDVTGTLDQQVVDQITAALSTASAQLTSGLSTATSNLGDALTQVADALRGVVDITTNLQSTSGGTFSETALQVDLLSAAGSPVVRLNVANATVGPNAAAAPTATSAPTTTPPPSNSAAPIKVDAGRAGPFGDDGNGGISLVWVGVLLIAGGAGGTFWLRRKAPGHL